METCFETIHRIGTPEDGLGEDKPGCTEVQIRAVEEQDVSTANKATSTTTLVGLLNNLSGIDIISFKDFTRYKIVWFSPSIFLVDSEGPFDHEFYERHNCSFLMDLKCGPTRPSSPDLMLSVCLRNHRDLPAPDVYSLDGLLYLIRALGVKFVGMYGDLERASNGNALQLPFSPQAIKAFLRGNDLLTRIHSSDFRLDEPQFAAFGAMPIPNLRLGYVEQEGSFTVTLNAKLLEFDVGEGSNNCIWSLDEESNVETMIIRTRQPFADPIEDTAQDDRRVRQAESLSCLLPKLQARKLCLRANWFTNPNIWDSFCRALAEHPTLQVIQFQEFIPLIRPDRRRLLCNKAVLQLVQSNSLLQLVEIPIQCRDELIWTTRIQPCLDLNKLRPGIAELQRNTDLELRRKAVGRLVGKLGDSKDQLFYTIRKTHDILFVA